MVNLDSRQASRGGGGLLVAGVDIGGTQCSVNLGRLAGENLVLVARDQFPTGAARGPGPVLGELAERLGQLVSQVTDGPAPERVTAVGVSCGGPLDAGRGLVQSPPNLPGWDDVPVVDILSDAVGLPCTLENDANAGALAEWRFGAGRGCSHLVFLTFGTGLGAGLVLDGHLYRGQRGLAGELGHWRTGPDEGPVRYGKAGSLESYCSGSGIVAWYTFLGGERGPGPDLSARTIAFRARSGEALARRVFDRAADQLGQAVALVADLLAPEVVVIGGMFGYAHDLMSRGVEASLRREAHPAVLDRLRVVPAGLGDRLGSFASCCVALDTLSRPSRAGATADRP